VEIPVSVRFGRELRATAAAPSCECSAAVAVPATGALFYGERASLGRRRIDLTNNGLSGTLPNDITLLTSLTYVHGRCGDALLLLSRRMCVACHAAGVCYSRTVLASAARCLTSVF
jgi:hypothetical protein